MAAHSLSCLHAMLRNFDNPRKSRVYGREIDPLGSYTENELRSCYRFGRESLQFIIDLLSEEIAPATRRSHSLPGKEQVLITLTFLVSGSFLEVVGNTFLSYDKSTVSRVIHRLTQALSSKVNNFIEFPSTRNERDEIKQCLFKIGGFPCAIGCIDGTHVSMKGPSQNEPDYVNRKGFHSINVEAVCNHEGKQ